MKSAVIGLDGVSGIKDQREQLEPVFGIIDALEVRLWIGSGLLLLASLLLVANTIRLAAMARRARSASCGWSAPRRCTSRSRSSSSRW